MLEWPSAGVFLSVAMSAFVVWLDLLREMKRTGGGAQRRGGGRENVVSHSALSNLWLALRERFFIFRASAMGKARGIRFVAVFPNEIPARKGLLLLRNMHN